LLGAWPTRIEPQDKSKEKEKEMSAFAKELSKFTMGRGSIQFPLEKPLPLALIRKITALRVRESLEKDGKWKTGGRSRNLPR
jgi:uncharacterized protein YdhG (YjbR/CyaY superfamily)